jgi:hypothetical protein
MSPINSPNPTPFPMMQSPRDMTQNYAPPHPSIPIMVPPVSPDLSPQVPNYATVQTNNHNTMPDNNNDNQASHPPRNHNSGMPAPREHIPSLPQPQQIFSPIMGPQNPYAQQQITVSLIPVLLPPGHNGQILSPLVSPRNSVMTMPPPLMLGPPEAQRSTPRDFNNGGRPLMDGSGMPGAGMPVPERTQTGHQSIAPGPMAMQMPNSMYTQTSMQRPRSAANSNEMRRPSNAPTGPPQLPFHSSAQTQTPIEQQTQTSAHISRQNSAPQDPPPPPADEVLGHSRVMQTQTSEQIPKEGLGQPIPPPPHATHAVMQTQTSEQRPNPQHASAPAGQNGATPVIPPVNIAAVNNAGKPLPPGNRSPGPGQVWGYAEPMPRLPSVKTVGPASNSYGPSPWGTSEGAPGGFLSPRGGRGDPYYSSGDNTNGQTQYNTYDPPPNTGPPVPYTGYEGHQPGPGAPLMSPRGNYAGPPQPQNMYSYGQPPRSNPMATLPSPRGGYPPMQPTYIAQSPRGPPGPYPGGQSPRPGFGNYGPAMPGNFGPGPMRAQSPSVRGDPNYGPGPMDG